MREINGTHLIVDAYVKDASSLGEENMFQLFDGLVEELNMAYLRRPVRVDVPLEPSKLSNTEDEGGSSYYCLITTSHISAHTWELRRAIMFDVFSCRPFNASRALVLLDKYLNFSHYRKVVVDRIDPQNESDQIELSLSPATGKGS